MMDERVKSYWENIENSWANMAAQWQGRKSGLWLLGPANYVLKTSCLWAVDPMLRGRGAEEKILPRVHADFEGLRFILLSHLHPDHYSLPFLAAACRQGVKVIVPEWMEKEAQKMLAQTGAEVIPVKEHMRLPVDEITIDVLPGWHYDFNKPDMGVPSLAFLVTDGGRRFLFPSDVRDYDHCIMPTGCDAVFSHVWLGRGCAMLAPEQTALNRYLRFVRRLQPKLLLLTHLYDVRRKETDQWTERHARWIEDALERDDMRVITPVPGENIEMP